MTPHTDMSFYVKSTILKMFQRKLNMSWCDSYFTSATNCHATEFVWHEIKFGLRSKKGSCRTNEGKNEIRRTSFTKYIPHFYGKSFSTFGGKKIWRTPRPPHNAFILCPFLQRIRKNAWKCFVLVLMK